MKYKATMHVPHNKLAIIDQLLAAAESEDAGEISVTCRFPNGFLIDIKCCTSVDGDSWTEAVLFGPAKDGELPLIAFTQPADEFAGEWKLEDSDGNEYIVNVVDAGDILTNDVACDFWTED